VLHLGSPAIQDLTFTEAAKPKTDPGRLAVNLSMSVNVFLVVIKWIAYFMTK
ncbi:hypothetical protein KIPB_017329, partial [Kipferlia bialata]